MANHEDWSAALSSEVFRNFIQAELAKEASVKDQEELEEMKVIQAFAALEEKIRSTPELCEKFKKLQEKFINDPSSRNKNPKFAESVMLLDLDK